METAIAQGTYIVIRADGTEESYNSDDHGRPTIERIEKLIGANYLDTVNLRRIHPNLMMMVDDNYANSGRPVNAKATKLYHSICKPGTTWEICGDVALVNDEDYA
jgi:hypothetical protein